MEAVPRVNAPRTASPSGFAYEDDCFVEWMDERDHTLATVRWTAGSRSGSGERTVERWDGYETPSVTEVEDGGGNRFVVIRPVRGGRLELSADREIDLEALVADTVSRVQGL